MDIKVENFKNNGLEKDDLIISVKSIGTFFKTKWLYIVIPALISGLAGALFFYNQTKYASFITVESLENQDEYLEDPVSTDKALAVLLIHP